MTSRVDFRASDHSYRLDGQRVPGVTTTINRAHEKPGLVYAAAREAGRWAVVNETAKGVIGTERFIKAAAMAHRDKWDESAKRGTLLHDAARQLIDGHPITPESDGEPWPDDVVKSAEQLARFMDDWDVTPLVSERPVFHERDRWAGTVDLVATMRRGGRWLLDYKTGETGVYPKDALQLAVYRRATHVQVDTGEGLADWAMPDVDNVAAVWIRPDFYEVRPVLADMGSYQIFRHMLPVAEWTTWKRDDVIAAPLELGQAS